MRVVRSWVFFLAAAVLLGNSGCLVNIPSVRGDGQGPWSLSGRIGEGECIDEACEGPAVSQRDLDEVPWPKYHPVPTRPVFAPAP